MFNTPFNNQREISEMTPTATYVKMLPSIPAELIKGFRLYRSPSDSKYFNVVAVNDKDKMLAVVSTDNTFDEAALMLEMLTEEYGLTSVA